MKKWHVDLCLNLIFIESPNIIRFIKLFIGIFGILDSEFVKLEMKEDDIQIDDLVAKALKIKAHRKEILNLLATVDKAATEIDLQYRPNVDPILDILAEENLPDDTLIVTKYDHLFLITKVTSFHRITKCFLKYSKSLKQFRRILMCVIVALLGG